MFPVWKQHLCSFFKKIHSFVKILSNTDSYITEPIKKKKKDYFNLVLHKYQTPSGNFTPHSVW